MASGRKDSKQTPAPSAAEGRGAGRPGGDAADLIAIARGLAAAVSEHGLTELIIDTPEATFTVRRGATQVIAMPALAAPPQGAPPALAPPPAAAPLPATAFTQAAPAPVPHADEKMHIVKSPFVGTFYRRPNPDSPEYAKLNDKVSRGSVLCIIEAMKLMNEIESDIAGTLVAVLAEDGAPVEYDQPLFKIAPA
jgi:acetyl-CoA carboxylase biotin carboxyl carrier protein